jgi:hypothetical protein
MRACATYLKDPLLAAPQLVSNHRTILQSYHLFNPNTTDAYVQFFDKSSAAQVVVGTTSSKPAIRIQAGGAANLSMLAWEFVNGIVIAATTTSSGSTAPAVGLVVNLGYESSNT